MMLLVEVGSSGDAEWAEHLGYAAYLTKPVQRDELGGVFKELLQRSVAADSDTARLVTRHSMRETRRRRLHCLVVDDDRVNLIVLRTVIERLGHAVDIASCGTEALEKATQQRYDLILSDVRMPDIDGDEVATRLLAAQSARGERPTPIFAMSANSLPGDSQRCRAAGMRNYFHKPVTLPLLAQLLRYALEDGAEPPATENGPDTEAQAAAGAAADATDGAAANPVPEQDFPDMDRAARFGEVTPIDLDHLEMASVGVPELRREMLKTFQLEMAAGIERLGAFIDDGNHGGAAVLASAMNSTCASIGAMECARHLGEIERRASAGDLRPLGALYAESLAEWDRVKAFAATLLDEPGTPGS
jgi:CheY-like chemotaxis protein